MSRIDPILEALGGYGRYQVLQYFLSILAALSAAFQLLNIVFVGRNVPHVCMAPDNIWDLYNTTQTDIVDVNNTIITYEKCNIKIETNSSGQIYSSSLPCLYGYNYTDPKDSSIMSYYDIVCDDAPLRSLGQTLLVIGQAVGALTLTYLSDRVGRWAVMIGSHVLFLGMGLGIAFVPNYTVFLVLRVFLGFAQQGIVLAFYTSTIEAFSTRYRKVAGVLNSMMWSTSCSLIPWVAYIFLGYSWRYMQMGYCVVSLWVFVQFFFMDETLPWLITNRKTEKVNRILAKAAKISGRDPQVVLEAYKTYQEGEEIVVGGPQCPEKCENKPEKNGLPGERPQNPAKDPTKPSFIDLMKRKRLAITVFILWFTWLTDSMTYFGLFLTAHNLIGDRFVNVFLLAIIEAPSVLIFYFMVDRYGRKKTSMALHGIAGVGLVFATIFQSLEHQVTWASSAVTVWYCVGMFGISGAWSTSFFFTPEMFPTNLRNFGLGTSSSFSRLGAGVAPFSSLLAEYIPWAPGAIFGACCMLVTFLIQFLPETMGRPLPQTLEDMEDWFKTAPKEVEDWNKDSKNTTDDINMKKRDVVGLCYGKCDQ